MSDANYFDQFDSLRAPPPSNGAVPASSPGANFFDQYDNLRGGSRPSSSIGSIARQIPVGFNEGLADVAGFPVDATTWALNKGIKGANAVTGGNIPEITNPVGGSESIKSGMGLIGADPRATPAKTTAEKIARAGGGGVAAMIAPEAEIAALVKAGAITARDCRKAAPVYRQECRIGRRCGIEHYRRCRRCRR